MDVLQLVFAFVNAPLFATFLLGNVLAARHRSRRLRRSVGRHGGGRRLITVCRCRRGPKPGIKGGWLAVLHHYPSEMAQNFWTAICAFRPASLATIVVSLVTRQRKTDSELTGLVYALTPRPKEDGVAWYKRPATLGVLTLLLALLLNIIFW